METKTCCQINREYLPVKAHYFFLFGGMAGTVPFMQILGKDLGISATAVGLVYTVVPFCVFLAKPTFGYITDYFQNIKVPLMGLITVTALSFLAVLLVPPIPNNAKRFSTLAFCTNLNNEFILLPRHYDCFNGTKDSLFKCRFSSTCLSADVSGTLNVTHPIRGNVTLLFSFPAKENSSSISTCDCLQRNESYLTCSAMSNTDPDADQTYNFWAYALLAVVSGTGSATTFCLSDAACYEVLGRNSRLYGRQRVWATISWGIITFGAGYLNDITTKIYGANDYSPGFYLMLLFVVIDLIILLRLQLLKANISTSIFKDVGKIYQSRRTLLFSFSVYVSGALTGLVWNYQFWYLTDLGASQTLLGLVIAIQCLVAEVPLFFLSGWFVTRFGHYYCVMISLAAFALRLGLYALLKNPWFVLPIELLHGSTFAVFYAAMTMYAADCAPLGTEATMLGVLGGIFEGLGVATGSLLGGIGFDKLGGHETFFIASMISLTSVFFLTIAYMFFLDGSESAQITRTSSPNYGSHNTSNHELKR